MNNKLDSKENFYHHAQAFLATLWKDLTRSSIYLKEYWMWDHLCYRVDSLSRYQYWSDQLSQWGELLIESEVGNRMISTFKLKRPISFQGRTIELIELPAPKAGSFYSEGFEHLEVVCDETFREIKKCYPQIQFIEVDDKVWNSELKLKLGNYNIKFHHCSLESIIEFEKKTSELLALQELDLLRKLKSFSPLIAGTFPLGIAISKELEPSRSSFSFLFLSFCLSHSSFIFSDQFSIFCISSITTNSQFLSKSASCQISWSQFAFPWLSSPR